MSRPRSLWDMRHGSKPLVEIAYAAGIQPAFPENYAAVSSVKHLSRKYCETAEAHNYGLIYAPIAGTIWDMFTILKRIPLGGLGIPDLLFLTSCACTHYFKWWDALHEIYNIPLSMLTPRGHGTKIDA